MAWFALSLIGATALNLVMKALFARPRPTLWTPALPANDSSFPSGHTMFATALAATVVVIRWRWVTLALGTSYAVAMMPRAYTSGVHYPTDVLAGAAFSLAWVVALAQVLRPDRALR